jgi:hypothetical protein
MTTTNPFSLRRSYRPHRLRSLLALLATLSLSACGGGDENGDQAAGASGAGTPDPSSGSSPASGDGDASPSEGTPIRITFGNTELTARLHDNATARDLAVQLPLTLIFRDHNNVEKSAPLPRELSQEGAPEGHDPAAGDMGARWRLGLLLRQRRPVLQRHRAHRRVRRRDGRDRAPDRRLQRQDRTRGMTHRRHRLRTHPGTVDFPDLMCI